MGTFWAAALAYPVPDVEGRLGSILLRYPLRADLSRNLQSIARDVAVPAKTVALAAHMAVLAVIQGRTDVMTALTVMGRPETAGADRILGLHLNTNPLRIDIRGRNWQDLIQAVQSVTQGKSFFSPAISKMMVEDYMRELQERQIEDSYDLLTTREREVLQLLAEGKSNKEVAAVLNLSLYTIETHRGNILQKLNLHSGAELILYAIRKGVIT